MDKVQLEKFKEALEAKREEIIRRAEQTLRQDMALDADDFPDEMDLASSEYLQAFTLGVPRYTPEHVREQIRAAKDVGIHGWVLWNPRSAYDPRIFARHAPVRLARSAAATTSASSPEHEVRR